MLDRTTATWLAILVTSLAAASAPGQDQAGSVMQDNIVVLLDTSGSMKRDMPGSGQTKMEVAKDALIHVLSQVPDTTNVGVVVFTQQGNNDPWIYPLGTIDRRGLDAAIRRPIPSGETPLGKFMKTACDRLLEQRAMQYGYGTYRLLIVTDGQASDMELVDRYLPDILSRGIVVDVIGVNMKSTHALATRVHSYQRGDDPESLVKAVSEVFAEVGLAADDSVAQDLFETIAPLPDNLVEPMLQALSRSGNHPIGTRVDSGAKASTEQGHAGPGNATQGQPPPATPATDATSPKRKGRGFLPLTSCFVFVVVAAVVIRIVIKSIVGAGGTR